MKLRRCTKSASDVTSTIRGQARNDYIQVVLDRSPEVREAFLKRHRKRELTAAEQVEVWKLLELQRHAMLMYTSCGWFFDELSGIETVQVIQYAGRVVQLAQELFEGTHSASSCTRAEACERPEEALKSRWRRVSCSSSPLAKSNIHEHRDGAHIYEKFVKPTVVDLHKVGAHYAISSVFNSYPDEARIYCYTVRRKDFRTADAGKLKLVIGRATFTSEITLETGELAFGVLHFGDHNLHGGVRAFRGDAEYEKLIAGSHGGLFARRYSGRDPRLRSRIRRRHVLAEVAVPRRATQYPQPNPDLDAR